MKANYGDVLLGLLPGHVAQCEINRPPNNFFDLQLIKDLADCFADLDEDSSCRAIVLCSNGKHFCAGAAIGGGFGLAMMADFRVVCENTRMTANFVKLGFTPGFGLTHTLARIIGIQKANLLFLTGRRINGETAMEWGLADIYAEPDQVRDSAIALAREIAENAPLALISLRRQMRPGLADAVRVATDVEGSEQFVLMHTDDHREGVQAVAERRVGNFTGN